MSLSPVVKLEPGSANEFKKPPSGVLARFTSMASARKEARYLLKYGIVGAIGAIVDFSILNYLIFAVGWSSDGDKLWANVISVSCAIVSNFTFNRLWTFPGSRARNRFTQFAQFTGVALTGLVLNTIIFYLAGRFIFAPILPEGIAVQIAKATAIGLVLFWNFGLNRLWTFRGV